MAEVEDDLCNQVAALKEQLLSEQSHKDKLETSLTQQLIETRIEMGKEMRGGWSSSEFIGVCFPVPVELQGLKDEAGRERTAKEEVRLHGCHRAGPSSCTVQKLTFPFSPPPPPTSCTV